MLTTDDILKMQQVFATKQDLENFTTKEEFNELKNEVLDRMDAVFGEVKAMREEQASHFQIHEDIDHKLASHEKLLKQLKSPAIAAHQIRRK